MNARLQRFETLQQRLQPLRSRLVAHEVYSAVRSLADLHVFLQHHVFAVWDFMSLLKGLQRELTSVDSVWVPRGDAGARRLINEIVLGEESDQIDGQPVSHFEYYLAAMRDVGASTEQIDAVLGELASGRPVDQALVGAPAAAVAFCRETFAVVASQSLPAVAAAFTLGREDVIPAMFTELVRGLLDGGQANARRLLVYLERHIELDGDEHGPMAAALLANICGDDDAAWQAAERAATASLQARLGLWDGVLAGLRPHSGGSCAPRPA
ncbi:MAG: DUF3050 domain-containing protein [Planctomycetota bacterium]